MKNKKLLFWLMIELVIPEVFVIVKKPTRLVVDIVGG